MNGVPATYLTHFAYVAALLILVAGIFLTPLAIIQAYMGQFAGVHVYWRLACWGAAFMLAVIYLFDLLA